MTKKILTLLVTVLVTIISFGQHVINTPRYGMTTAASSIKISKIELTDTATVLFFDISYTPNNWIIIPDNTFIKPVNSRDTLYIKNTEGVPFNKKYFMPDSGIVHCSLIFPPIDTSINKIDYGEANGTWHIYDISLNNEDSRVTPEKITGNWYNTITGNWEISFFDSIAVYKQQLWHYGNVRIKKNGKKGTIELHNKSGDITFNLKRDKKSNLLLGAGKETFISLNKDPVKARKNRPEYNKEFKAPLFKLDTITYSGYIRNYTPRCGVKTGIIYLNNILTGDQENILMKINPDGTFSVKIPVYYPHKVFVRSDIFSYTVFIEPGQNLFQMIMPYTRTGEKPISMGNEENAILNNDLSFIEQNTSMFLKESRNLDNEIIKLSAEQYKDKYLKLINKQTHYVDSLVRANNICKKAEQVKTYDIKYRAFTNIISYKRRYESAFRKKHKAQTPTPVKIDAKYYDFINNNNFNDPLAPISISYGYFINYLKYSDILRSVFTDAFSTIKLIDELKKEGYNFKPEQKEIIAVIYELDSLKSLKEYSSFVDKYSSLSKTLFRTYYRDILKNRKDKSRSVSVLDLEQFMKDNNITIGEKEEQMFEAYKKREATETAKRINQVSKEYSQQINNFFKEYSSLISSIRNSLFISKRDKLLADSLGLSPGPGMDIMTAQDYLSPMVSQLTPVSNEKLQSICQQIKTPFIKKYITISNEAVIAKIEANKNKSGYTANKVPETEADKLFDAIISKYRGKVVYVDFWATWCGPCRSGITRIAPLKEEMKDKDVVFIYITNPSSPENTWKNMIPDIKGEHYRVSSDEWNYLSNKFSITGIPHYALVDKDGNVINPNLPHMDNTSLKRLLEKQLGEN